MIERNHIKTYITKMIISLFSKFLNQRYHLAYNYWSKIHNTMLHNQPRSLSVDEWIKKTPWTSTHIVSFSHKNMTLPPNTTGTVNHDNQNKYDSVMCDDDNDNDNDNKIRTIWKMETIRRRVMVQETNELKNIQSTW